jgi:flagellar biosynthetic protein FliR
LLAALDDYLAHQSLSSTSSMISISSAQLDAWLAMLIFPMVRVLALVATAPIFNNAATPVRTRLIVGLAVTLALVPVLPPMPNVAAGSWITLAMIAEQMLIGVLMGFTLRIAFVTVDVAGELIGLQMGLSFAVFYDPQNAGQTPVLSEFLGLLTALFFLGMNGHLMILMVLAESFTLLPVSIEPPQAAGIAVLLRWSGVIFASGLLLSLPLITALLIANIALGVLSRIAPQLNLFAVGFPVTMAVGYVVLMFVMPYFGAAMEQLFHQGFRAAEQVLQASGGIARP